jgi:membrane protease YdiL (CAAX protease family)
VKAEGLKNMSNGDGAKRPLVHRWSGVKHRRVMSWLKAAPLMHFIVITLLTKLALSWLMGILFWKIEGKHVFETPYVSKNSAEIFLLVVILGPLLENYFLIHLPWKLFGNSKPAVLIAVTSVLFGLLHHYNVYHIINATVSGFVFTVSYWLRLAKNQAFVASWLLHMFYNLFAWIVNEF